MKPRRRIAVVGAGITGRLIAWQLSRKTSEFEVSIFEEKDVDDLTSCSYAAAGMLAPLSELATAEPVIARMGWEALKLWRDVNGELGGELGLYFDGTLIVATSGDSSLELEDFYRRVSRGAQNAELNAEALIKPVGSEAIDNFCPGLAETCSSGFLIANEGRLSPPLVMTRLHAELVKSGVTLKFNTLVLELRPHQIKTHQETLSFDEVIDCRGLAACHEHIRGVRGESLLLESASFKLTGALRLLHHRYPIYIVPRSRGQILVGATVIESDDNGPITVKSTLELLAPLFRLHPAFHYARIIGQQVGVRPAYPDHLPQIAREPGLVCVNGLYRHGFLLAPVMAKKVLALLN